MFKLYLAPATGGFAVHALLEELGATYELISIDTDKGEHRSRGFRELNPLGQVPVLDVGAGHMMTESAAMMIYLCDRYPSGGLAPAPHEPARAGFLRWLTFMAVNIYMADLRTYYPDRYTKSKDETAIDDVRRSGLGDMNTGFRIVDQSISNQTYLLGETFSAADLYLLMLAWWHPSPNRLFRSCPHVARTCARVAERPAVQKVEMYHNLMTG